MKSLDELKASAKWNILSQSERKEVLRSAKFPDCTSLHLTRLDFIKKGSRTRIIKELIKEIV